MQNVIISSLLSIYILDCNVYDCLTVSEGGLSYAWGWDAISAVIIQMLACVFYAIFCVLSTQQKQLLVSANCFGVFWGFTCN